VNTTDIKSTTWHTKSDSWHGRARENIAARAEGTRRTRRHIAIAYLIGLAAFMLGECLLGVGQFVFDLYK